MVHLGRSQFSVGGLEFLAFAFYCTLHFRRYPVPVFYYSDAEEVSPQIQPVMLHFEVVGFSCVSRSSRSILSFLELGSVVQPSSLVEYLVDHDHACLVSPF